MKRAADTQTTSTRLRGRVFDLNIVRQAASAFGKSNTGAPSSTSCLRRAIRSSHSCIIFSGYSVVCGRRGGLPFPQIPGHGNVASLPPRFDPGPARFWVDSSDCNHPSVSPMTLCHGTSPSHLTIPRQRRDLGGLGLGSNRAQPHMINATFCARAWIPSRVLLASTSFLLF